MSDLVLVFAETYEEARRWAREAEVHPRDWRFVVDERTTFGRGVNGRYVDLLRFSPLDTNARDIARHDLLFHAIKRLRTHGWREIGEGA